MTNSASYRRAFDGLKLDERAADLYIERLGGLSFDFDRNRYEDQDGSRYGYEVTVTGPRGDALRGSSQRDHVIGLGGDDRFAGGVQDDILYGGEGKDVLTGGIDQDRLEGGSGDDRIFGGDQDDDLAGGEGDDFLDEGIGHGDLEGGMGNDILVGGQGPDAFAYDRMTGSDVIRDFTAGPGMFDHIVLRAGIRFEELRFDDTDPLGVRISWQNPEGDYANSVLLEGVRQANLAQDDFMFTDVPDLPPGSVAPSGPAPERNPTSNDGPEIGDSTLTPVQASFDVFADGYLGLVDGFDFKVSEFAVGVGGEKRDDLTGTAAVDNLFGRSGNDRLVGLAGDDVLQGDRGNDRLEGGAGADWLDGGAGDDRIEGGDQADLILGEQGRDRIDGGGGHDMIEGGKGDDLITGGAGADAFIVEPGSGDDVVFDFLATGAAQGAFDHIALRDIRPDQVRVADTGRGALVSWNTEAGDGSLLLDGVAADDLRQSDFMFFEEPGFVDGVSDVGSYLIFPQQPAQPSQTDLFG
ncbi:MAG: calcium-binding protein [Methylobacterium sp.]|uniref:calcium-binding protein n=1 Tax=Methylobacterium sp. TaxID=409 RepID=UPI0025F6A23C|nr:calcium-binding protein [Methylobacterium sp.]MBX9933480.1 calcium-binding protein [Methylobacterium sp.]